MSGTPTSQDLAQASAELLDDILARAARGEVDALFDPAQYWISHIHERRAGIELSVAEGMLRFAAASGDKDAQRMLLNQWDDLRPILLRRLTKR